jgi:single-stranded-DNA-specific exonuclease
VIGTTLRACVLGVERSVLEQAWHERLNPATAAQAIAIGQQHGVPDLVARVLAARGVGCHHAVAFLSPKIRTLMPDPDSVRDMGTAIDRLVRAVRAREPVAIFGDYDVDGAASAALLAGFLEAWGCRTILHIPDRIFEGYGPNVEAIQRFKRDGAKLLVTVDCGSSSFEPLAEAHRLGLDAVVIDHHQIGVELPTAAAIVNPNRHDDLSGLGHLCAAGVVFMVLVGLQRALRAQNLASMQSHDLLGELDLVALATIADMVPLAGLNRAFVSTGLEVMKRRQRPGLAALMDLAGADGPPRPYHLAYLAGPRINAGGRIGDASLGARLLMMRDPTEVQRVAGELDRLNRERQALEVQTLAEAEALAAKDIDTVQDVLLSHADDWHPGIVGLVASRLKERYRRPAFAVTFKGRLGTGSGRSIAGVDIGRAVRAAVDSGLLVKGGGHAMAAGITVWRENLPAFRSFLAEMLGPSVQTMRAKEALLIDATLAAAGANLEVVDAIERVGPFGPGNPEPIFAFPAQRIADARIIGAGHIRVRAAGHDGKALQAIAFRAANTPLGEALLRAPGGAAMHLAGTLSLDHWGGSRRVQVRVVDAAAADSRIVRGA